MLESENHKIFSAVKWSVFTEIGSKLLAPITSMVLARVLAPEAFGVISSLSIVITFSEILADAGFQRYMIQHEFCGDDELRRSSQVAFWSNFICSCVLWIIIAVFRDDLSALVGSPGLGWPLLVAALAIPLSSLYSIPVALLKRSLDFKSLFKVRIIGGCVPLLVTLPMALYTHNYWALIIGTLSCHLVTAVVLLGFSRWRPTFFFSWRCLKDMFSFSMWSMFESVSIWLAGYVDLFIVGNALNQYYLGLYKTSTVVVTQITGIVTSVTTPVLFAALSRLQQDRKEFKKLFFRFQKLVALFVMPIGVSIYGYHDFVTRFVLGEQWLMAAEFLGLWGLSSTLVIVFCHSASEVYRSLGKPRLSALAQWLHIIVLWPAVWWAVREGFETLYQVRTLVRLQSVLVNMAILWYAVKITPWMMIRNVLTIFVASLLLLGVILLFQSNHPTPLGEVVSMPVFALFFIGFLMIFPRERLLLTKVKPYLSQRFKK